MNHSLSSLVIPSRPRTGAGVGFLTTFAFFLCSVINPAWGAAEAFSSPRGIYTVKVTGKPAGQSQARTYFGVQLLPDPKHYGVVSAVSGNAISFNVNSSYSGLADPDRTSYAHVITGDGRGFIVDIVEFGQTDIRCAQDLSGWITPGTQVSIRPHPHLADLFGTENRFGLGSGLDAHVADNVVAWDPQTQQERVYYFHSTRARWEEKDIEADASRSIMRFPYGLYIVRRSPGTLRIALSGEIRSDPLLLPVRTGANVFSLPINLSASLGNLINSAGAFPVLSGPNSNKADLLTFEEPSSGIQRGPFYHSSMPSSGGWREVGESGSQGEGLDLLSTLILHRTGPPGYIRAEGSLAPGPVPAVLPPDPGESPLDGVIALPWNSAPGGYMLTVQISTDLQTWTNYFPYHGFMNPMIFRLPVGQSRYFYRVKLSPGF